MSLRILLVDDHQVVREGLRALIDLQPDMEVVAVAGDGTAAFNQVREMSPDLVIMDVGLPHIDGIDATRNILSALPKTKILALSMHSERAYVYEMLRAGASGYVIKDSDFDELLRAIKMVMNGQMYLSPKIVVNMVDDFVFHLHERSPSSPHVLSAREIEVLQLMAGGKSTKEMASHLQVSVKTIETHRRQIMEKTGIDNVAQLTKYAIRMGLASL